LDAVYCGERIPPRKAATEDRNTMRQDVYRPEALGGLGYDPPRHVRIGHVTGYHHGAPTQPGYLPGNLLGCFAVLPAADGHVGTRLGQAQSRGRGDPARTAGHQGHLAVQIKVSHPVHAAPPE
jgi:hypothetical protein